MGAPESKKFYSIGRNIFECFFVRDSVNLRKGLAPFFALPCDQIHDLGRKTAV